MWSSGSLARRSAGLASVFHESWQARGTSADGSREALGEYNILPPTGGKAFFHFLLDASGSTWDRCGSTGDGKRVYEYLLDSFFDLILNYPDVVRSHDEVSVWLFNKETQLLCRVQQKDFHSHIGFIRTKYRDELDVDCNYRETRLYDAVGRVVREIRETWAANKKADFFLVPFTDGQDNTSILTVEEMWNRVTNLNARLHTFFITANLPAECALYRLRFQNQGEMSLIELENTGPREISRGFVKLRDMIKAILVVVTHDRGEVNMTRLVEYGESRQSVSEQMMRSLAVKMENFSLVEAWYSLRPLPWSPTN